METEATRSTEYSTTEAVLYMAFELSNKKWKLGFTIGQAQEPRLRTIAANDLGALRWEIGQAKKRFGLAATAPVRSCYEAGREGFWLHRALSADQIENLVVDSASIEVNRRRKRRKTDRLDVVKLVTMLLRYHHGERKVWSVVHVPSVEAEDGRQLHRELVALKAERTQAINRLKGLLASQGVRLPVRQDFRARLERVRLWDGSALPPALRARLEREYAQLQFIEDQIKELERMRAALVREAEQPSVALVRQLLQLRGIGIETAWQYVMEFFGWREFRNRRQVGALAGLNPTPYQSGDSSREQGISKAGNRLVRHLAVESAWSWLRHQPDSALSRWYEERFGQGGPRQRKIGIVALARKLLIALWRYLATGELPEGALLKA